MHSRSVASAVIAGLLALMVLGIPIASIVFLGFVSWTGFWFLDGGRPASKVESMLWFALAGLLVVDVTFWAWAGLRRFPLLLTTVAVIPPVVLGAVYVIGVLSRAF